MKVIASSIRKGNVIEQDGKLYVVLTAENIHPGKGTPVSQIEMRRISDGVKISERYKTTDQVEKATIEDQNFNYLYKDADGFHFMNNDNYDQVQVPEDVIGTAAAYLQENMTVKLSLHGVIPVAIQMPQRATLEVVDTEPVTKGQTASMRPFYSPRSFEKSGCAPFSSSNPATVSLPFTTQPKAAS